MKLLIYVIHDIGPARKKSLKINIFLETRNSGEKKLKYFYEHEAFGRKKAQTVLN